MRVTLALLVFTMAAWHPATGVAPADGCRPLGYDKAALLKLRSKGFVIEDAERRRRFAFELLGCLGDPDPVLRDQVAYEGFATLLRGKQLDPETIGRLRSALIEQLASPDGDEDGFRRPFAALVLSEVARADRIDPLFSDDERAALVEAGTRYLRGIDDYRGFDEVSGWRHGVAHGADLLMQLALNPALDRAQLLEIRAAVGSQIVPAGAHFYIYGESGRLARPVLFIALHGQIDELEWADWFERIGSPKPFDEWADVYATQAGLAKLHNTRAFARAIYANAEASDNVGLAPLGAGALAVLRALP